MKRCTKRLAVKIGSKNQSLRRRRILDIRDLSSSSGEFIISWPLNVCSGEVDWTGINFGDEITEESKSGFLGAKQSRRPPAIGRAQNSLRPRQGLDIFDFVKKGTKDCWRGKGEYCRQAVFGLNLPISLALRGPDLKDNTFDFRRSVVNIDSNEAVNY